MRYCLESCLSYWHSVSGVFADWKRKRIQGLTERSGCDGCWLAAHKEINQQILDELPPSTRNRISKNLPRDLTKLEQKELLDQFLNANFSAI